MRLNRLIAILLLLESRGLVKARELADALETCERTIYRDIDALCAAGVPILSDTGPNGGFSLMEGYSERLSELRADDVVNLYLSGIGVRPERQSESSLGLANTLRRLEASLPAAYRPDVEKAKTRFYFDPEIWWRERAPIPCMDTLRHAVWDSVKLRITYRKTSFDQDETSERVICPYGLVVKDTEWYLAAHCDTAGDMRSFKCERILSAVRLENDRFQIPDDFSLEVFWRNHVQGFKQKVLGVQDP